MVSFSTLEQLVQHHLDDKAFSLSSTRHLAACNRIWRKLIQDRRWAEYWRQDTTILTVAGQEAYVWPLTLAFYEEPRVDRLDSLDSNRPYPLNPVGDDVEWAKYWTNGTGTPQVYRRYNVAGVTKLALRPAPTVANDIISISGKAEPRAFVAVPYSTVDADSASAQAVLNVAATTMFAIGDKVIINEGGAREEIITILSISAGVSITGTTNLVYTHTAAQADRAERMTDFLQRQSDEALALLIAAEFKAKRGFSARAAELIGEASALLPKIDSNPSPQSNSVEPYGIGF